MIIPQLTNALKKSVTSGRDPFQTYKEFALRFGFNAEYCPSWANRPVLDAVAKALKADPIVGLDLTFVIRNKGTKYPSVIDGSPFDRKNQQQKNRARQVADQIIKKYALTAANPYPDMNGGALCS